MTEKINQLQTEPVLPKMKKDLNAAKQKKSNKFNAISKANRKEIVGDLIIKNIVCAGVSKNHSVNIRCDTVVITFNLNDFIRPTFCIKPDAIRTHSWANLAPNSINTLKNIKNIVKEITGNGKDQVTKITNSGVAGKGDIDAEEVLNVLRISLKDIAMIKSLITII